MISPHPCVGPRNSHPSPKRPVVDIDFDMTAGGENMLRSCFFMGIFGSMTGKGWGKLLTVELHNFYSLPHSRTTKSRRMRKTGHVACMR
jgi:hypothetical protein